MSTAANFRSREWMLRIASNRKYKNQSRGEKSGRSVLTDWKVKMIRGIGGKITRELAERIGRAAGVSAGYIYQLRRENPKTWKHLR